jgi:DNA-binding transcriptional MerR regulator
VSQEAALNKAPDAFRTISEVAEELDLPQHVLRFWESRFPHIKPLKRGGGRRYYRPEDIDLLRGIRHLLYSDGYTIRGVQRILREQGVRTVQSVWQGQEQEAPNLGALPHEGAPDGVDGHDARLPTLNFLSPPDSRPRDEADDESRRTQAIATAPQPMPKNGPIAGAESAAVAQVKKVAGVSVAVAPVALSATASPVAVAGPPRRSIAAQDLDRLKHALTELEACRRLLDKAHEAGR